jgi:parvulin-like peptidyl-prolyl isomerase
MKKLALVFVILVFAALPLALAACGEKEVPAGAIAAVGDGVVTQQQFDEIINQVKAQYGSQQGATFPKEGSAQYDQLKAQIVTYLIQSEIIVQQAKDMGVSVSDKELAASVKQVEQSVGGAKEFKKALKQYGMTQAQLEQRLKTSTLQDKVKQKVYADVKVTDEQVKKYYEDPKNKAQFHQAASRDVRHILVKTKAEAEKVRALLAADDSDANWKKVAAKYSTDPGSKDTGGLYSGVQKGQMTPKFDQAVWSQKSGQLSEPVKTPYGWHIIEVVKDNPKSVQTLDQAKEQIRQMLLYQAQTTAWQDWLKKAEKDAGVVYAPGFDPDALNASASPSPSASPS